MESVKLVMAQVMGKVSIADRDVPYVLKDLGKLYIGAITEEALRVQQVGAFAHKTPLVISILMHTSIIYFPACKSLHSYPF